MDTGSLIEEILKNVEAIMFSNWMFCTVLFLVSPAVIFAVILGRLTVRSLLRAELRFSITNYVMEILNALINCQISSENKKSELFKRGSNFLEHWNSGHIRFFDIQEAVSLIEEMDANNFFGKDKKKTVDYAVQCCYDFVDFYNSTKLNYFIFGIEEFRSYRRYTVERVKNLILSSLSKD